MTFGRTSHFLWCFTLLFIAQSCADYKLHYSKDNLNWQSNQPTEELAIKHTMYLIGDAGGALPGEPIPPGTKILSEHLKAAGKNSSVVYLGDNIYPDGMAPKSNKVERAQDEYRLKVQMDILKDYKGEVFFLPGNHDWYGYSLDGVKRQKKFIEDYLDRKDVFFPKPGCGDPATIKLNDQLTLIIVDSQWYLKKWDGVNEINDGCEIKSREVFARYFEEAIKKNRNKNIVVAMHHPSFTNGPHGGQYTVKEHLFPLTIVNKNLYIPLPVIGSIAPFYRANIGHIQDAANPNYKELMDIMIGAARKNGSFIFAAGHEHNLQYFESRKQSFIVSGAGSKRSPSNLRNKAQFTYGKQGFSKIDFYEDGSAWMEFWAAEADSPKGKLVFKKKIKSKLKDMELKEVEMEFKPLGDTMTKMLTDKPFSSGPLYQAFWGKHYRQAYSTPVEIPILDMNEYKGGVIPVKRGGGYQTNSLRLEREDKKQFAMRSVDKDASRTLTYPFNQTIASDIIRDNFSAAHPLAALAIPPLAEAAGIYYSNPKLYYVQAQERLGIFNSDFADAIYLIEERPDDEAWGDSPNYGYSKKIISTIDVIDKTLNSHDHVIDQEWTMRSRLFDVLIGDWDRHDDQWRWARIEDGDRKLYRPIPRDRDQAFSNYDGPILAISRQTSPNLKKLQLFKEDVKKIQWLIYNGRHFDRTFLSGVEWDKWEAAAKAMQTNITDAVIDSAFQQEWPAEIYAIDGPKLSSTLKARRNNLMTMARDMYEYLAKDVDVIGTEKRDLFKIERLDDEKTRIRIYDTNKEGDEENLYFDRTFLRDETKEIIVYGLDGDDFFNLSGTVKKGIKIRIIGGLGDDIINDNSKVGAGAKKTLIYDSPEVAKTDKDKGNHINAGPSTGLRLSPDPTLNTLYRRSLDYEFNYGGVLPAIGWNVDAGLLLGLNARYTTYGFKKSPYSSVHSITGKYAAATNGISLDYYGEFLDVFGKWEFQIDARYQTPLYAINFYGLGNETVNPEVSDPDNFDVDYNRVSQGLYSIMPAFAKRINDNSIFLFGPTYESIGVDSTVNNDNGQTRFINTITDQFEPELFDELSFLGARALLDYQNQDDTGFPTRGIGFFTELGWKTRVSDSDKSFGFINSHLSFYFPFDNKGQFVFGTRVGVQHRFNDDYEFYQGAMLGGLGNNANIRGFRRDRFVGRTAFFQNLDLRWKIISSKNKKVPFSVGVLAGFDYGRVWLTGEDSEIWHYGYGGGVFISPLDLISLHISVFNGDGEEARLVLGSSFFF